MFVSVLILVLGQAAASDQALRQAPPPPLEELSGDAAPMGRPLPLEATAPAATPYIAAPTCGVPGCFDGSESPWIAAAEGTYVDSSGCPCPSCDDDGDTKICKLKSTCDLYPHYAYYPKYHGYYYFRPYNYQTIAEHQQFAMSIGLEPGQPYSLKVFDRIYSNFPMQFTPSTAPIGTALPEGNGLPELESLLERPVAE